MFKSEIFVNGQKKFFYKVFFFYAILIVTLLPLVGMISYHAAVTELNKEISMFNIQLLNEARNKLEAIMNNANETSVYIAQDEGVRQFLKTEYDIYNPEVALNVADINTKLADLVNSSTSIDSMAIYHSKSSRYILANYGMKAAEEDGPFIDQTIEDNLTWIYPSIAKQNLGNMDPINPLYIPQKSNSLVLVRRLPFNSVDGQGALLVGISESIIEDALHYANRDVLEGVYVLDSKGNTVYESAYEVNEDGWGLPEQDRMLEEQEGYLVDQDSMYVFASSDHNDWCYIVRLDYNRLLEGTEVIFRTTITTIFVALFLSLCIAFVLSKSIYRPIEKLLKVIKKVQKGDFEARIESHRNDELGFVHEHFNTMVEDIDTLIKDLYTERILKQEEELKVLQEKMNPHFLYNTLNAVACMANINGQDEIEDLIRDLSNYFRISLAKGKDYLTFEEVKDQITSYMKIQENIYPERFEYNIQIDDEIMDKKIPKNLIEPIIENALIHGVLMSDKSGFVNLKVSAKDQDIVIEVEDNGIGIEAEKLEHIMKSLNEKLDLAENSGENFALRNVKQRLNIHYGMGYSLSIKSKVNQGTTVCMKIKSDLKEVN